MPSRRQQVQELFAKDATLLRDMAEGRITARVAPYMHEEPLAKSLEVASRTAITPLGSLQALIRPVFTKQGVKPPTFGPHPDYVHLLSTANTEHGAITTLFLDVANSTRLGLVYPLDVVYRLKNAVLCTAIEIVNAFDGHVHRLMGDAALAFFGDKSRRPEDGAIDALNCAATLRYYIEAVVVPALEGAGGPEDGLGIRIGLDHGPHDKVLWSAYGYPGNEEVTATSFHVDVASKLQHAAGRNRIMIGQSLRELLDFPEDLLRVKTETVGGEEQAVLFVRPNYTLGDGSKLNYRQHLLRWEPYLATTGVAGFDPERFEPNAANPAECDVAVTVHPHEHGPAEAMYGPASRMVSRGKWLHFELSAIPQLQGAEVTFVIENHGAEAEAAANLGNATSPHRRTLQPGTTTASCWAKATYRGFHYMTITVTGARGASSGPRFRRRIGVYVE